MRMISPISAVEDNASPTSDEVTKPSSSIETIVFQGTLVWFLTRVAIILLTWMSVFLMLQKAPAGNYDPVYNPVFDPYTIFLHWKQWDADWYLAIASLGHYSKESTVYFPLYPQLIQWGGNIFGPESLFSVAMAISWIASLPAFIGIALLAAYDNKSDAYAMPTLRVTIAYPLMFFLAAPYTESLFLALAVWALYLARRGIWFFSALCAVFAMLTRSTGIILWLPMVWELGSQFHWWSSIQSAWKNKSIPWYPAVFKEKFLSDSQFRWNWIKNALSAIAMVGAIPLGLLIYMIDCYNRFGDPIAFISAEKAWTHEFMPPWELFRVSLQYYQGIPPWSFYQARFWVDLFPLLACIAIIIWAFRRWPFSYTLYMIGLVFMVTASPTINGGYPFPLMSVSRYLVIAIPVFLFLGAQAHRRSWVDTVLVSGGFLFQGLFIASYLTGGWIV
jgi:hypothetical protein